MVPQSMTPERFSVSYSCGNDTRPIYLRLVKVVSLFKFNIHLCGWFSSRCTYLTQSEELPSSNLGDYLEFPMISDTVLEHSTILSSASIELNTNLVVARLTNDEVENAFC